MTVIIDTPNNLNFLPCNNFRFGLRRAPTINFTCQKANIPGISLGPVDTDNPLVKIPHAGDHLMFNEFSITFTVDEKLLNYLEIHNWLRGLGFDKTTEQFAVLAAQPKGSGSGETADGELIIYDSQKVPIFSVTFTQLVPTSLGDIQFSTVENDVIYAQTTAVFRYMNYDINPVV